MTSESGTLQNNDIESAIGGEGNHPTAIMIPVLVPFRSFLQFEFSKHIKPKKAETTVSVPEKACRSRSRNMLLKTLWKRAWPGGGACFVVSLFEVSVQRLLGILHQ